ncbi:hypothetical protein [Pedobacter cryoconitis]|uniref:hypothetical protein n=1 Tax=Pedobacter cryoconitis TaxID=188932 RepID=UPI00160A3AC7|nr:hypothetical protein [Pedobacter cryoconitis]MBB5648941.1 hypothetical protein [Pedobacter cryoconitis]
MNSENIKKWEPVHLIPNQLYIDSIIDDHLGLTIVARGEDSDDALSIWFRSVLSYQSVDETCTLKRLEDFPILSTQWPLFISSKSSYIDWIVEQSYQIVDLEEVINYIITHGDGIIDVISNDPPEIKWI